MENLRLSYEKILEMMKNNPKKSGAIIFGFALVMGIRVLQKKLVYFPSICLYNLAIDRAFPKSPAGNPKPYRNPT